MHVSDQPDGRTFTQGFDGEPHAVVPGEVRLNPSVCEGWNLAQEHRTLRAEDFDRFLRQRGLSTRLTRARADLVYIDIENAGTDAPLRFRVAVLDDAGAAGRDLHIALLQHGKGRWGVHRSNLAVLGPEGSYDDIVAFAARTKLACWGVLTLAGLDDTFVIPGGYAEL